MSRSQEPLFLNFTILFVSFSDAKLDNHVRSDCLKIKSSFKPPPLPPSPPQPPPPLHPLLLVVGAPDLAPELVHGALVHLPRPLQLVLAGRHHVPQLLVLVHPRHEALGEELRALLLRVGREADEVEVPGDGVKGGDDGVLGGGGDGVKWWWW